LPLSGTGSCLGKVCFKMPLERVECVTDRDRKEVPVHNRTITQVNLR